LPYIVATRSSDELLKNLASVDAPILFEGLHTCFYIDNPSLAGRIKIIRMHNVEQDYYRHLAADERNLFRKIYYRIEAMKLERYEKIISLADRVVTISPSDQEHFKRLHKNSMLLPAFHGFDKITSKPGHGSYFLFHGNLSVNENRRAALFLIDEVFCGLEQNLVIAGKNPGSEIRKKIAMYPNLKLRVNPGQDTMDELIANAQACVLPTFQPTGLKLKLLSSLFAGRYCIANPAMAMNTGLEKLCIIANNPDEFRDAVKKTAGAVFSESEIEKRKLIISSGFSNKANAEYLYRFLIDRK
jgi:glycosyltransferase involved in cell wall biosynthesis